MPSILLVVVASGNVDPWKLPYYLPFAYGTVPFVLALSIVLHYHWKDASAATSTSDAEGGDVELRDDQPKPESSGIHEHHEPLLNSQPPKPVSSPIAPRAVRPSSAEMQTASDAEKYNEEYI